MVKLKFSDCKNHHFFALFRYFALFILLFPFKLEGQYRFNFEIDSSGRAQCCLEGNWQQFPHERWCCDSIFPIEGGSSLHHSFDNSQEGCDYLVFRHDPLILQDSFAISFRIRHAYLPSNRNNWQLALGATFEDGDGNGALAHIRDGLVLGVNFSGSDDLLKLWHVEESLSTVLCSTPLNYQETVGSDGAPLFRLRGDGRGGLDLWWSPDPEEQPQDLLASCRIDDMTWGRQLVLRYKYTSSRDMALWLDALVLEGHFEKDSVGPELISLSILDAHSLQLDFSEEVVAREGAAFILYSDLDPAGRLPAQISKAGEGFHIFFPEVIPNRIPCRLQVAGLADMDGNVMADTLVELLRNEAGWGDVVFNEIMADPEPAIRQVEEYVELFNRSGFPVNMKGWALRVNDRSYALDASIPSKAFLLLTGITLPNKGAVLTLHSRDGTRIHAVSYRIPWDGPPWKADGGWSLESPDPELPCRVSFNWEYSADPGGGTPGWANSWQRTVEDVEAPVLLYCGHGDRGELLLNFSEPIQMREQDVVSGPQDPGTILPGTGSLYMDPGQVQPDSARFVDPLRQVIGLYFTDDFRELPSYQLHLPGISDCAGNWSAPQVVRAGAISKPLPGSVVLNEIMYDPMEGKAEYVELFLPGPQILDLKDLAIHPVEEGGSPDRPVPLSSHSRLVFPGQYLVLSPCVPQLEHSYGLGTSGRWVEIPDLPGLNNSSGGLYLTDRAGQVLDQAAYSDQMHMELLDDPRGVSLERISITRPGHDPGNWHSAASLVAYATPGERNSQSLQEEPSESLLEVSPEVFSPDNDGKEDLLRIALNTGGNDWLIGLVITDLQGKRIRELANNHLVGPSATYVWDGTGEDGSLLPMGFYVVHVRGYGPSTGEKWIIRKAVGLVYR